MHPRTFPSAPCHAPRFARCTLILGAVYLSFVGLACRDRAPRAPAQRELVVFAAASLRDVFGALARPFTQAHPGAHVTFNFAGTQELRAQIEHGAAFDVLAAADERHVEALVRARLIREPIVFARNEPVLVVSLEAASRLHRFEDLPFAGSLVVGAPEVPIGRYTRQVLDRASSVLGPAFRAQVLDRIVSHELNVRHVLNKVRLGEAEAGIVYRTDARMAAATVIERPIPSAYSVGAVYPIAVAEEAAQRELARMWVAFVRSAPGRGILRSAGFEPAEAP